MSNTHTSLSLPSALLCDMDGVLVDSEALHWESVLDTLRSLGALERHPAPLPRVGWGDHDLWREYQQTYQLSECPLTLTERRSRFAEARLKASPPPHIKGSLEGLLALKIIAPSLPIAVVSASPLEQMRLSLRGYGALFEFLLSGVDDCEQNKPSPEPYLRAAERLGVPLSACWVVEDSPTGLSAALAGGAQVWCLGSEEGTAPLLPQCLGQLSSLLELSERLA